MTGGSRSRRVLVTGASRPAGIGAAVAAAHAARGDAVAVHARADLEAARAVAAGLPGEGHAAVRGDLTDPAQAAQVLDDAVAALDGLDVLVHNAGVYVPHPVTTTPYAEWQTEWRRTLDVNLLGPAYLTWCFVHHLQGRPEGAAGGRIVMVGSRGAYRGEPDVPAYGASKAGLHAFAQSLAVSLAPHGIAVAAVAPSFVRTDLTAGLLDGPAGEAVRAQHPLGRLAEPAEIAAAVAWLTSAEAEWATGAVLDVNGASYLR